MDPVQEISSETSKTRTPEAREKQRAKMQKFRERQRQDPERLKYQREYDRNRKRRARGVNLNEDVKAGQSMVGEISGETNPEIANEALDTSLGSLLAVYRVRISEELDTTHSPEDKPVWKRILNTEVLQITGNEARQIEKSQTPGKDLYDKLADIGYTAGQLLDLVKKHGSVESSNKVKMYIGGCLSVQHQSIDSRTNADSVAKTAASKHDTEGFQKNGIGNKVKRKKPSPKIKSNKPKSRKKTTKEKPKDREVDVTVQSRIKENESRGKFENDESYNTNTSGGFYIGVEDGREINFSIQPEPQFVARKLVQNEDTTQICNPILTKAYSDISISDLNTSGSPLHENMIKLPENIDRQLFFRQAQGVNKHPVNSYHIDDQEPSTNKQLIRLHSPITTSIEGSLMGVNSTHVDTMNQIGSVIQLNNQTEASNSQFQLFPLPLANQAVPHQTITTNTSLFNLGPPKPHIHNGLEILGRAACVDYKANTHDRGNSSLHDYHKRTSLWNVRFEKIGTVDIDDLCHICTFLPDGRFIYSSGELILMDSSLSQTLSILHLGKRVYNLCPLSNTEVIIARETRYLQLIDVSTHQLTVGREIDLGDGVRCYRVDVLNGEIYAVCKDNTVYVRILNRHGQMRRQIFLSKIPFRAFEVKIKVGRDKIFVTSPEFNKITCMSTEGDVLFHLPNDKTRVGDTEFVGPSDMQVDGNDNLMVCCTLSNNTHLFNNDETEHKVLIDVRSEDVEYPHCVSYRESDGCLVVGGYKQLVVYKARWQNSDI